MNRELMLRKQGTIREMLEKPETRKRIKQAIPAHVDEAQFSRIVLSVILSDEKLIDCTQRSLLTCVMAIAQLGLSPIPMLGQAYLVPFRNKGVMEAVFIPGYRGYISLARRSGEIQSVTSQEVFENDHFFLQYGTEEKLDHRPNEGDRGKPKGYYVVFHYKDGGHSFDYMTLADVEKIRDRFSKQPEGLMWKETPGEGGKKTVIRRHVKIVPLAVEEMHKASALEDQAYRGEDQFDMVFPEGAERPELPAGKDFFGALNDHLVTKGLQPIAPDSLKSKSLNEFLEVTAQANNEMTIDELKGWAIKDLDGFWGQFEIWEGRQPEEGKPGVEGAEATPAFPFAKLKRPGLLAWEKEHRDELPQMDTKTQKAFLDKWKRIVGMEYPQWLAGNVEGLAKAGPPEERDETGPKGFDLLKKKMVGKIATVNENNVSGQLPIDLTPDQANQLMGFLEQVDQIDMTHWIEELKSIGAWKE